MNTNQSPDLPTPESDDEPLRIREAVVVTAIVAGTCLGFAALFTAVATCKAVEGSWKLIRRKVGSYVP